VNERKKQLCTVVPKAPSRFGEFSLMTRRYALHIGQSSLLPVRVLLVLLLFGPQLNFPAALDKKYFMIEWVFADQCVCVFFDRFY